MKESACNVQRDPIQGSAQHPSALWALILLALFVSLYLALLGARPLFMPDEVRYAEIAREMISSGDWIVPRLDGLLYFEKPPFGHWLNAISLSVFGYNGFAVRFASAIATGASALTVFMLAGSLFPGRRASLVAVFVFLTTLEVRAIGNYGVLDSMFSAFLNAGIALFALGAETKGARQRMHNLCAGILFGIAFLTKGFLAFALPCLILVPWLLHRRQYALLLRGAWLAVGAALLVVLPWAVAIHREEPDFWRYFIWVEHVQRFAGENAQHKEPFWFYLKFLPFVIFPWTFLLPAALKGLAARPFPGRQRSAILLLVLWTIVPLVFFSIAKGKLVTYILPCLVPFAILMGAGLCAEPGHSRLLRFGLALTGLTLLAALAVLVIAQVAGSNAPLYESSETTRLAALVAALAFGAAIPLAALTIRSNTLRSIAPGMAFVPVLFVLPLCLPATVIEHKAPVSFLKELASTVPSDTVVISDDLMIRAVTWAFERDDIYVIEGLGELAYGLARAVGHGRFLEPAALSELLRRSRDKGVDVLVVCKEQCAAETLQVLPDDVQTASRGTFVAWRLHGRNKAGTNSDRDPVEPPS